MHLSFTIYPSVFFLPSALYLSLLVLYRDNHWQLFVFGSAAFLLSKALQIVHISLVLWLMYFIVSLGFYYSLSWCHCVSTTHFPRTFHMLHDPILYSSPSLYLVCVCIGSLQTMSKVWCHFHAYSVAVYALKQCVSHFFFLMGTCTCVPIFTNLSLFHGFSTHI